MGGQGRLARPRFRYTGSITFGIDDNVLSAPFNGEDTPAVTQELILEPAQPARVVNVEIQGDDRLFPNRPTVVPIFFPAKDAVTETVVLAPAIPKPEQIVSFVGRANAGYEVQFATRRTVFTMDLNGSASFYTNRPGDQTDFNGSLAFSYLTKITPRLQFSSSANIAYLSQPDISRVNAPTTNVGDYLSGSFKMDLIYRWTRRFATVTSFSGNTTLYSGVGQESGNYFEALLGTEGRYGWTRRTTLLGELRYGMVTYESDPTRDSSSLYLIGGMEFVLSSKLTASLRLGAQMRTFTESGESAVGPFSETALTWRYHRAGQLTWASRIGFEEPPDALTTVQVYRTGINLAQAFSARLRGTAGFAIAHRLSSREDLEDLDAVTSLSIDAGLQYSLSRHTTLTANYSFTGSIATVPAADYLRNQLFFGFQYAF